MKMKINLLKIIVKNQKKIIMILFNNQIKKKFKMILINKKLMNKLKILLIKCCKELKI